MDGRRRNEGPAVGAPADTVTLGPLRNSEAE